MGFHPAELCQRAANRLGDPHCGDHAGFNADCSFCTGQLWMRIEHAIWLAEMVQA